MRKTNALFGLASSLLLGAVILDLWPTSKKTSLPPEPPPPPPPPLNLPKPLSPTPGPTAFLGEVVTMEAALSHAYVRAGGGNEIFLRLNLDAKDTGIIERPPMALALVLDRSGSMAGDKMEKTREAAKRFVDRLSDRDQVSLISFSTDFTVDFPLGEASASNRVRLHQIIDQVFDGGGTNISGGLDAGLKQLKDAPERGMIARLVLMSDGNANQGITDINSLSRIAQTARLRGVTISTLGVGTDFNEDLMTAMAESAGGSYHYARDSASISVALDKELDSLAKIAARQVEVGLELAEGVVIKEVYGYRTEVRRGKVVVPVGDMHGSMKRQVLVRLEVPGSPEGATEIVRLALAYKEAQGAEREYHGALTTVTTRDEAQFSQGQRNDVLESVATVLAATTRKAAAADFASGNRALARRKLVDQIKGTREIAAKLGSVILQEQAVELESALGNVDAMEPASPQGQDLIKSEKYRARELGTYRR